MAWLDWRVISEIHLWEMNSSLQSSCILRKPLIVFGIMGCSERFIIMDLEGIFPLFIRKILANRKITVRIGTTNSRSSTLAYGVAKGSVVGPTLFSLMINDIFDDCPCNVLRSFYADDGVIWLRCAEIEDGHRTMQDAIDSIERLSEEWGLKMSSSKTNIMVFTKKDTGTCLCVWMASNWQQWKNINF